MKERFKSPVLWMALLSLAAFVCKTWLKVEIEGLDEFTDLLLAVLAAFGIVNNPTDREHF